MSPRPDHGYSGPLPPGLYVLRNAYCPTTVLDLSGGCTQDGTLVMGQYIHLGNNQQWIFEIGSQGYRLKNAATGTYLSFPNDQPPAQDTSITGNKDHLAEWQVVKASIGYEFRLASSPNLVLDLYGWDTRNSSRICLYERDGGENQQWICDAVSDTTSPGKPAFDGQVDVLTKRMEGFQAQLSAVQHTVVKIWQNVSVEKDWVQISSTKGMHDSAHDELSHTPSTPEGDSYESTVEAVDALSNTYSGALTTSGVPIGGEVPNPNPRTFARNPTTDELEALVDRTRVRVGALVEALESTRDKLSAVEKSLVLEDNRTTIDNAQSFAATALSLELHDYTGIRVYYPSEDGIAEITSQDGGFATTKQNWVKAAFLADDGFQVADGAPLVAINTHHTDQRTINVYFVSTDNILREWVSDGSWKTGLAHPVPNKEPGPISAVTWSERGVNYRSVFYVEQGKLKEITKGDNDPTWQVIDVGPLTVRDFTVVATVENSEVVKRVYTTGREVMTFKGNWSTRAAYGDKPIFEGYNLMGVALPLSYPSRRFYLNTGAGQIVEYADEDGDWNRYPMRYLGEDVDPGTIVSAAAQSRDRKPWIFLIHRVNGAGKHLSVTMYNGAECRWVPSTKIGLV